MNITRIASAFKVRNKEFIRDRTALAWNFIFPMVVVIGFAFAFNGDTQEQFKIGVYSGETNFPKLEGLEITHHAKFIEFKDLDLGRQKVAHHQIDMLIDHINKQYWINQDSSNGWILPYILNKEPNTPRITLNTIQYSQQQISGKELRYVDWLLPGILALNMMFSALSGVGYIIVRYRKNGVLKRFSATPLTPLEFLVAQVASRLWLVIVVSVMVYVTAAWLLDFSMKGSYVDLLIFYMVGAMSIISLGLLIAARIKSEELAEGILNLISWPMMFMSGVWFSLDGLHPYMQKIALMFPLTHLIEGARAIMLDGQSLSSIYPETLSLLAFSIVFLLIGAWQFRWE